MSNKNKRQAGKKKGRDKGVKKKKNETRVQRNVRQNMQRAWTRIHVYRIDGSLLVSPTTAVRTSTNVHHRSTMPDRRMRATVSFRF